MDVDNQILEEPLSNKSDNRNKLFKWISEEKSNLDTDTKTAVTTTQHLSMKVTVLWQQILTFLDLSSLAQVLFVSSDFLEYAQDLYLWKEIYSSRFCTRPLPPSIRKVDYRSCLQSLSATRQRHIRNSYKPHTILSPAGNTGIYQSDGKIKVCNDRISRLNGVFVGNTSIELAVGLLPLEPLLKPNYYYYEVEVFGTGASVGLSSLNYIEDSGLSTHVGWNPISIGLHTDNGQVYWNDMSHDSPLGSFFDFADPKLLNQESSLRTISKELCVIGIGYNTKDKSLFFTINGKYHGHIPSEISTRLLDPETHKRFTLAVAMHSLGDMCKIHLGSAPFAFNIESHIIEDNDSIW